MGISIPALALGSTAGVEGGGLGALLGGLFGGGGAAAAGLGAADAASAPLDILAGGAAAGTAIPEAAGTIIPATGALASGLATEPAFAASALGTFAPGLDTTAAGLGIAPGVTDASAIPGAATPASYSPGSTSLDNLAAGSTPSGGSTLGTATAPSAAAAPTAPPGSAPVDLANLANTSNPAGAAFGPGGTNVSPVASGAVTPGTPTSGGGGFWDNLLTKLSPSNIGTSIGNSLTSNPLGTAAAAGGLGYNILQGQKQSATLNALAEQAQQQGNSGAALQGYLTGGTLPPGLAASVTQQINAQKAAIISQYAAKGLSTDPAQNSALAQDLANAEAQAPVLTAQIGEQLFSAGSTAAGLSASDLNALSNAQTASTQNIGKAISTFAAALAGKNTVNAGGTTITVGGP